MESIIHNGAVQRRRCSVTNELSTNHLATNTLQIIFTSTFEATEAATGVRAGNGSSRLQKRL
eukprot:11628864-Karenia_brevis.AAC.1